MARARTTQTAKMSKQKVSPPSIVGEKRVKRTEAAVAVKPAKRKQGMHDGPTNPAAIDQRRQITGTDEPVKGKGGRVQPRSGGNPGRGPVGLPGKF
jgi:hypothetical protein